MRYRGLTEGPGSGEDGMNTRALPAAFQATALSAQPLSTGNLLADCERWCRDSLPPRHTAPRPDASPSRTPLHR